MDILRNMGLAAILSLLLSFTPLVMAVAYVVHPSERRLALMRPLSQVGLFAALAGTAIGLINSLVYLSRRGFDPESMRIGAVGTAESLVALSVGFGCLTVAWLLVAAGMGRQSD
jgi:hypothetical protein